MNRSIIDREPISSTVHKSSVSYSVTQSRLSQKGSNMHLAEYSSQEKSHKKGIITSVTFNSQNVANHQNSQQQQHVSFIPKQQQSLYEQYLKSLENEISSREKQRIQLQKGIDQLQNQNIRLFNQLTEQKKKSAHLWTRIQQLQILSKQTEQKKRTLTQEKQMIFKQYQYELQRSKNMQGNQIKLRSSFQTIQNQFLAKNHQLNQTITKLKEENQNLKLANERQLADQKAIESLSNNYKQQLNETVVEKDKIIEVLLREKGFVEKQYQKGQKQHLQLHQKEQHQTRSLLIQKEQQIKILSKKLTVLQQQHELQKDQLNYQINQVQFEITTLKKQNETTRSSFNKQIELTVQQNQQLKIQLSQLQKQKKVDYIHNQQLHKVIDKLQREINTLAQSNLSLQKQKQSQQKHYQQQLSRLFQRIQQLQSIYQQKCTLYEQMYKHFSQAQGEYQNYRRSASEHIQALVNQLNLVKTEFSKQVCQFTSEISKLHKEKDTWLGEISRVKTEDQQVLKAHVQNLSKQNALKEKEVRIFYQNHIDLMNQQVQSLTQQILRLNSIHSHQIQQLNHQHFQKVNKLQKQSLNNLKQLQEQSNQQINEKLLTIRSLNEKVTTLELRLQKVTQQLKNQKEAYNELEVTLTNEQNQLKSHYFQSQSQLKYLMVEENNKYESQIAIHLKQKQKLIQTINYYANLSQTLQTELKQLKQIKFNLQSTLQQAQQTSSSTTQSLNNTIITLQQQKAELNSQLFTIKHNSQKAYNDQFNKLTQKIQHFSKQKNQLYQGLNNLLSQILSVIQFAQKYSGQVINKRVKMTVTTSSFIENSQIFENGRNYCQSLNTFIGERLYVISILMQENSQLKLQVQKHISQHKQLEDKIQKETIQRQNVNSQHQQTLKQLQEVKKALQSTNKQNIQSIAKLKQHITSYKRQLVLYQSEIQQISLKFQQHQLKSFKSETRIAELEQQQQNLKEEILKLTQKHTSQIQSIKNKYEKQLQLIRQELFSARSSTQQQSQQSLSKLHNQLLSLQQKLTHHQKLIQTKTKQYQQLENHSALLIQRTNESHQVQIQSLQREIRYLKTKSDSSSYEIMKKRIQLLQNQLQKQEKQLVILQDNNALLRKNFISTLSEQQSLREEVRHNRSQRSSSRSKSRELSRKDSQSLKNKYLLRKGSNQQSKNNTNEIVQKPDLTQSFCSQSYSNSNSNTNTNLIKRFESPRGSQTVKKLTSPNIKQVSNKFQRQAQTQRPVSNIQRSAPQIPLDLKRIRQRNQKYFSYQQHHQEVPSEISCQKMYSNNNNNQEITKEDELAAFTSPIKSLDSESKRHLFNNI